MGTSIHEENDVGADQIDQFDDESGRMIPAENGSSSGDGDTLQNQQLRSRRHRHSAQAVEDPSDTMTTGRHQQLPAHGRLPLSQTNIPGLCCAFLASMTTGGITYAFGLYGDALKKTLHLSQGQLETISTANFCAGLLSWIPGLLVDRLGTRFGISAGGLLGAAALLTYYAIAAKGMFLDPTDKGSIVASLSALGVTIFLSSALVTGSVFKIIVSSCGPGTKGGAVGVAKGYVGLGSGAYACLFQAIRAPGSSDLDFLPMAAFLFLAAASIPSFIVLPPHPKRNGEQAMSVQLRKDVATPSHFRVLYASLIALASIVVGASLLSLYDEDAEKKLGMTTEINDDADDTNEDKNTRNLPLAALVILIWVAPIVSLAFMPHSNHVEDDDGVDSNGLLNGDEEQEQDALLVAHTPNTVADGEDDDALAPIPSSDNLDIAALIVKTRKPQHSTSEEQLNGNIALSRTSAQDDDDDDDDGVDVDESINSQQSQRNPARNVEIGDKNLLQMLMTVSAWLMMWTTTILVGGGTVETNNLGQMVESLHFPKTVTPAALAIFSVAQAAGRVTTGAMSETALGWSTHSCCINKGVPRPFFLTAASMVGLVAHMILAEATSQTAFVLGTAMSGYAFGMVWPLLVLIVGEVFGTSHVAANYMFYDGFTSGAGTFFLSKILAQRVYVAHIEDDGTGDDDQTCFGIECFQLTHLVISGLCVTCIATSLVMVYTTRHSYNRRSLHQL